MKFKILIAILFAFRISGMCQTDADGTDMARLADELIGFQDEDVDYETIYENLLQVLTNPININLAGPEELRLLHVFSEQQITALNEHISANGPLLSLHELQAVEGFDLAFIQKITPLVKVEDPSAAINRALANRIMANENNYLITRYERTFEPRRGFEEGDPSRRFKGSEDRLYMRLRSSRPGDFSFGFTTEKDAGEQILWRPGKHHYVFDFLSYHMQLRNKGRMKNIVIGDYQLQFGQGLILGGAFGLGKGAESITTARRTNIGILPYSSVNETGFYRGAATTFAITKNLSLSGFYSRINRDGSVSITDSISAISSFQLTGLHRNESELEKRKTVLEQACGGVVRFNQNGLDAGLIFTTIAFSEAVAKRPNVYNRFTFGGPRNANAGAFLNYNFRNFALFSEAARSANGGTAMVVGLLGSLSSGFDISLLYRKFDLDYHSFYSNAFAENSQPQNESAFYWGVKYTWKRKYTLSGYADLFRFPWLSFRRYAPSQGHEWLLRFNYRHSRNIQAFIQVREESKPRNSATESAAYIVSQGTKRNYWLNIGYTINDHLKLKSRAQYSTYTLDGTTSRGLVLLQDLTFSVGKLQVSTRHALFDTEDYENRQYVYENDMWMAFSLPAYYGVGVRNYILAEYKFNKKYSAWCRYSRTRYTDRQEIGSGLDKINGSIKNEIKIQVLMRF